ncbi:hypothetical protein CBW54_08940 [Yersinia kristensenii]|nr:hypothetical protein CBW54_08940 [Yersinia kristensenii]
MLSAVKRHKSGSGIIVIPPVMQVGEYLAYHKNSYSEYSHEATDYSWFYRLHRQQHSGCCAR